MARKRAFDLNAVINAAQTLFWQRGYEGATLRALAAQTGVQLASLHNAFGDKEGLFRAVLENYLYGTALPRLAALAEAPQPLPALRNFLEQTVQECVAGKAAASPSGCLLLNTAFERAPHDAALAERVQEFLSAMQHSITTLLRRAEESGASWPQPPEELARYLVGTIAALKLQARAGLPAALMRALATAAQNRLEAANA